MASPLMAVLVLLVDYPQPMCPSSVHQPIVIVASQQGEGGQLVSLGFLRGSLVEEASLEQV